jgi:fructose-1-phosphate kinase PfkB-like protein
MFLQTGADRGDCEPLPAETNQLLQTVRQRLSKSVYISLRSIDCRFQDGELTFSGSVPTYYTKQVMLSLVEDLREQGVCRIVDRTRVVLPG